MQRGKLPYRYKTNYGIIVLCKFTLLDDFGSLRKSYLN
jgi:hypothetical protein